MSRDGYPHLPSQLVRFSLKYLVEPADNFYIEQLQVTKTEFAHQTLTVVVKTLQSNTSDNKSTQKT